MEYNVLSIDYEVTKEWLLKKHYAKRMCPINYSFGIYENGVIIGVCTFGTPFSPNLKNITKYNLLELNRLVMNDNHKKNALSFFVSKCLKLIPRPTIIVSYADVSQNHHGYIYQATNWTYTGLSAKRTDWKIKGLEHLHGATIGDMSRGEKNRSKFMKEKYGEDFFLEERPRKHRYFYFIGSRKQKKDMKSSIPYDLLPYPKGDNVRYDASYQPTEQLTLF